MGNYELRIVPKANLLKLISWHKVNQKCHGSADSSCSAGFNHSISNLDSYNKGCLHFAPEILSKCILFLGVFSLDTGFHKYEGTSHPPGMLGVVDVSSLLLCGLLQAYKITKGQEMISFRTSWCPKMSMLKGLSCFETLGWPFLINQSSSELRGYLNFTVKSYPMRKKEKPQVTFFY